MTKGVAAPPGPPHAHGLSGWLLIVDYWLLIMIDDYWLIICYDWLLMIIMVIIPDDDLIIIDDYWLSLMIIDLLLMIIDYYWLWLLMIIDLWLTIIDYHLWLQWRHPGTVDVDCCHGLRQSTAAVHVNSPTPHGETVRGEISALGPPPGVEPLRLDRVWWALSKRSGSTPGGGPSAEISPRTVFPCGVGLLTWTVEVHGSSPRQQSPGKVSRKKARL